MDYKINNSYSVHVNYAYYNECKKKTKSSNYKGVSKTTKTKYTNKVTFTPPVRTAVVHKQFGFGRIVETDSSGCIAVAFREGVKRFIYPSAFQQGFLAYT